MERNYILSEDGHSAIHAVRSTLGVMCELSGAAKFSPQFDSHELSDFLDSQRKLLCTALDSSRLAADDAAAAEAMRIRVELQGFTVYALEYLEEALQPGTHGEDAFYRAHNAFMAGAADNAALKKRLTACLGRVLGRFSEEATIPAPARAAPKPKGRTRERLTTRASTTS